nr:hypothetical protein [Tanacetum cinerariifolium]
MMSLRDVIMPGVNGEANNTHALPTQLSLWKLEGEGRGLNSLHNSPSFYDDDDDDEYSIQVSEYLKKSPIEIIPVLPTEEPDNSLSMGDKHLTTILKRNWTNDKNHFDAESDPIKSLLTRDTSIVYSLKIESLLEEFAGELADIDPIMPGIDETDFDPKMTFTSLSNYYMMILRIESLNNNPTPDCVLKSPSLSFLSYTDNSSLEFETFSDYTEETSSGSTTTHADNSLPEYDSFLFEIEFDQGELSSVVKEAILGEPYVYVPNVLPTHPTFYQDSNFSSFDDSFASGLEVSFPSRNRNKIFDPRIFLEVQSKRFLSRDTFSLTYVNIPFKDRHILSFTYVIRTFLPYFTYLVEYSFLLSSGSLLDVVTVCKRTSSTFGQKRCTPRSFSLVLVESSNPYRHKLESSGLLEAASRLLMMICDKDFLIAFCKQFRMQIRSHSIPLGSTAIELKAKKGVVLAVEKLITSPLLNQELGHAVILTASLLYIQENSGTRD